MSALPRRPSPIAAVWVGLLAAGCSGSPAETDVPTLPPPACPSFGPPDAIGQVPSPPASELSGIAVSGDRLWVHNDSGLAEVYTLARDGGLRATWRYDDGDVRDLEDIARGPGPDGEPWIWLGDIGDNNRVRDTVSVYRFREPAGDAGGDVLAERIELLYPDGPHDAETLLVDPTDGALYVVTKEPDAPSKVFQLLLPRPGVNTLLEVAVLPFGREPLGASTLVTGGDLGPDGLVLRTYLDEAYVWPANPGDTLLTVLDRDPCPITIRPGLQGEAIGWGPDGLYTVPEGDDPVISFVPRLDP